MKGMGEFEGEGETPGQEAVSIVRSISPFFHIIALIFLAGAAYANASAQTRRIDVHDAQLQEISSTIVDMKVTNAGIAQSLKDIHDSLERIYRQQQADRPGRYDRR